MLWNTKTFGNYVKKETNGEYELLSPYIKVHEKVIIRHNICGKEYEVTPNNFINGRRCPDCSYKNNKDNSKKSRNKSRNTESFAEEVKKLGEGKYTLISEYVNTEVKVTIRHEECGLEYEVAPYNFIKGRRCPSCSKKKIAESKRLGMDEVKRRVEEKLGEEYEVPLKQEYVNNDTKIKVFHSTCGNMFEATPSNLFNGKAKCTFCSKKARINKNSLPAGAMQTYDIENFDLPEDNNKMEIYNYFTKELKVENVILDCDTLIDGYTIDIYLPDFNLAINYLNLFRSSDLYYPDTKHWVKQTDACKAKGVKLIQIFQDEWNDKKDLIKNKLKYAVKGINRKVFARKCYIEEITDSATKKEFLNENHNQGSDHSCIALGLWYPDESGEDILVAMMTWCRPRLALGSKKDKTDVDYELSRYATQREFNVVGGFSKLFKYFERNYEWNKIVTYADRRWSDGNLYSTVGFKMDHVSDPSYFYVNPEEVKKYYRFGFRKQELRKKFPTIFDESLTEKQMCYMAGYRKLSDCGTFVFYYER